MHDAGRHFMARQRSTTDDILLLDAQTQVSSRRIDEQRICIPRKFLLEFKITEKNNSTKWNTDTLDFSKQTAVDEAKDESINQTIDVFSRCQG